MKMLQLPNSISGYFILITKQVDCTTPTTEPSSNTMTGCTLKAAASITGGSDFLLVQLKSTVPTNYNPYMNGWIEITL
jgi:hypothetical protein